MTNMVLFVCAREICLTGIREEESLDYIYLVSESLVWIVSSAELFVKEVN